MKLVFMLLLTIQCIAGIAQKNIFIRVYDHSGSLLIDGRKYHVTDSAIEFKNEKLAYTEIGFIRTGHSLRHNIGNGSLLGLGIFALDGILSPNIQDDLIFSKSTKVVLSSILIGLPSGVIGGVIYYIFKKRKRYAIKGDLENWTKFRAAFESNN